MSFHSVRIQFTIHHFFRLDCLFLSIFVYILALFSANQICSYPKSLTVFLFCCSPSRTLHYDLNNQHQTIKMILNLRAIVLFLFLSSGSACPDASLCAFEDCGSCGNACCRLGIQVSETAAEAMAKLNSSLLSGGPDGHYTAQYTAEGATGFADLTPYSKPVDYIGQAIHTTLSPNYYNDSISITISPPNRFEVSHAVCDC